jgi:NAD(P)-dependent dehydrogenase (short-subunit alcohol dehydrogenase family)
MAGPFDGKAAIVTGAGRGFGKAIALKFARDGAAVTVTSRSKAQLGETVREIEAAGGKAIAVAGDVTARTDVANVVGAAREAFGPADILISNAGITGPFGPIWAIDPDEWWEAQQVHVRGALLYSNAVLPEMVERQSGHIVVVSALAATVVAPNMSAYCVAKSSQNRLVAFMAAEVKPFNVATFAIEPGTVPTDLARGTVANPGAQKWMPTMVERFTGMMQDIDPAPGLAKCAELCAKLASGRYDVLSGQYLDVRDDIDATLKMTAAQSV